MSEVLDLLKQAVAMLEEAESDEVEEIAEVEDGCELSTLKPGEIFKVGKYEFIVLEHMSEGTAVISKGFMAKNKKFGNDTRNYNKSSLKKLIEKDIQPVIEDALGAESLVEHEVDLTSVDNQNEFGTCKCKVRPITFDEARKYNDLLVAENIGDWWWTCTPWSKKGRGWDYSLAVVSPSGFVNFNVFDNGYGVRPFCILKSNIFVSRGEA